MKIGYDELHLKSLDLEKKIKNKGILSKIPNGRYLAYQKKVKAFAFETHKQKQAVLLNGSEVYILKELREMVEVLSQIIVIYDNLPRNSKLIVNDKINKILKGPIDLCKEGINTEARDYQFEFRLAAKLIESGYLIYFSTNPDIVVEVNSRRYAIECKRASGESSNIMQKKIDDAVKQLIEHKEGFYAGIIAIDMSALLDKRTKLLIGTNKESASNKVLNEICSILKADCERNSKLKEYSHKHLVAVVYNYSGPYSLNDSDIGWGQGSVIMTFDKENPRKAKTFLSDFTAYREASIID